MKSAAAPIMWLDELTRDDVAIVGGKNASSGEFVRALSIAGISIPRGFATTAEREAAAAIPAARFADWLNCITWRHGLPPVITCFAPADSVSNVKLAT